MQIKIGGIYPFYSEVQEEYKPSEERLRRFTGTLVRVVKLDTERDTDSGIGYVVQAWDGTEFSCHTEEINGWDYSLDQFFWNDGRYGKKHGEQFLCNERN